MNSGIIVPNEEVFLVAQKEEPRLLNILLKSKESLQDVISFGIIPSENNQLGHFWDEKNNLLYAIIRTNFLKYGTLLTRSAMDSIVDMMNIGNEEERSSIKTHWDKIWNRHDGNIEDYGLLKDHINDRYILLQFFEKWRSGDQIIKATNGHNSLIRNYINELNALKNLDPDSFFVTMGIDEGVGEAVKFIDEKRANPHNDASILCGIDALDKIFHGFARPSYTVVSGMINGGKTTLMMNMGLNMARAGYHVAYVSLEKDAKLFFRRTLACHALTDYNRIKVGGKDQWGLNDYWYGKLIDAAKDLKTIKLNYHCLQFVQDTKLTKILAELDKLNSRRKIDVLFVDYLQVIAPETHTIGRYDVDLANIHKRLMAYGRRHNLVTFTALQLKTSSAKDIRKKADKVTSDAQLSSVSVNTEDYSGSQMIIADADNALGLVLNGDKPPTKMFVSISKARDDTSRGTISLDFDGKVGRVCDQEYAQGHVKAVDKELFEGNLNEEELASDDNLFTDAEEIEKKGKDKNPNPLEETNPLEDDEAVESVIDADAEDVVPEEKPVATVFKGKQTRNLVERPVENSPDDLTAI
jgi:replicative DNA helicase